MTQLARVDIHHRQKMLWIHSVALFPLCSRGRERKRAHRGRNNAPRCGNPNELACEKATEKETRPITNHSSPPSAHASRVRYRFWKTLVEFDLIRSLCRYSVLGGSAIVVEHLSARVLRPKQIRDTVLSTRRPGRSVCSTCDQYERRIERDDRPSGAASPHAAR